MIRSELLREIERLRGVMERRSRAAPLNSKEMLRLSKRLDRLINAYLQGGARPGPTVPKKDLRLTRRRFKIKGKK
jgi:hypothetical protein